MDKDAPFLACYFEDMAEQDKIPFDGWWSHFAQALVAPAGYADAMDSGDKPAGEGMTHHQAQAVGLGLHAFLQRGDLFQVAFEEFLEGGRFGLGTGHERTLVHLDLIARAHCSAAARVSKVFV